MVWKRVPPKSGFFTLFMRNPRFNESIFFQKWSKVIKSDQKWSKSGKKSDKNWFLPFLTGFFSFGHFWRFGLKNVPSGSKTVFSDTPQKWGVKELLYYSTFFGGQKMTPKNDEKTVKKPVFWTCPKMVDFIGSGTVCFCTFWPILVPTFWTKNWSFFGPPKKVRFFDFCKSDFGRSPKNHDFDHFFHFLQIFEKMAHFLQNRPLFLS